MTTDPKPLSAALIAALHALRGDACFHSLTGYRQCADPGESVRQDEIATLDEARATPSGDLAAALEAAWQEWAALEEDPNVTWDEWMAANLTARGIGFRSVSADSTAGLDVERLARALLKAIRNFTDDTYRDWPDDEALADIRAYVAPAVIREYGSPSTPPEATE